MSNLALEIVGQALLLLGEGPITSFSEETTAAQVASEMYEPTVKRELSAYPWQFARQEVQLSKMTGSPPVIWEFQYAVPSNYLVIRRVHKEDHDVQYEILGTKIVTNADSPLFCSHIFRAPESSWPPYFTEALVYRLAGKMAVTLTENVDYAGTYDEIADRHLVLAKLRDGQSYPQRFGISSGRLLRRRRR